MKNPTIQTPTLLVFLICLLVGCSKKAVDTMVEIRDTDWYINGEITHPGTPVEGLLMNVRMVNACFEDLARDDFDPEANTDEFIAAIPDYVAVGVDAFTLNLQGGMPGYEGAINSAFLSDGSLKPDYMKRIERVIRACNRERAVVILGFFYQRQHKVLEGEDAVRNGVVNAVQWIQEQGFSNVLVEIANEYPHRGFTGSIIQDHGGQAELISLAKKTAPDLLVSTSGLGNGEIHPTVAQVCDFLMPHWNGTPVEEIPGKVKVLQQYGKAVVCNEDSQYGEVAVAKMRATVENGAGYGLMLQTVNQHHPFTFHGTEDDPVYYQALKEITNRD